MSAQPKHREEAREAREVPRERVRRLSEVARRIRDDARHEPERTLAESEVPAGGE